MGPLPCPSPVLQELQRSSNSGRWLVHHPLPLALQSLNLWERLCPWHGFMDRIRISPSSVQYNVLWTFERGTLPPPSSVVGHCVRVRGYWTGAGHRGGGRGMPPRGPNSAVTEAEGDGGPGVGDIRGSTGGKEKSTSILSETATEPWL